MMKCDIQNDTVKTVYNWRKGKGSKLKCSGPITGKTTKNQ